MDSVTFREKEVLQWLSIGLSTKEIADRMNISFHTVESHRKNLRFKFAAKNSAELISKVMKLPSSIT
jgi:DNA-binding CsgD family transcriptional regulator